MRSGGFRGDRLLAVAEQRGDARWSDGPPGPAPAFSVTKMFVAVAALRLAEDGLLRLDDQASDRLRAPTVRELLGHTGGLPDYASTRKYREAVAAEPARPWGIEEITSVALSCDRPPRGRFRYSNLGYWLLGERLEQVTGEPLRTVLEDLVFAPAGLDDTRYPAVGENLTPDGYDTRWAGPAGAAWSTPADLARFVGALVRGDLLSTATLAAMTTGTPVVDAGLPWRTPRYGLGLMTDPALGVVGHSGGGPGYTSAAFALLDASRSAAAIAGPGSPTNPTEAVLELIAD